MVRTKLFRVALFLIVGSVFSAAPSAALARAQETALSGDQFAAVSGPPGSVLHAGKWTIFTNAPLAGRFEFTGDGVSLAGTLTRVVNVKIDAANNGSLSGTVSYVDTKTGVTCTGFHHGKLINLGRSAGCRRASGSYRRWILPRLGSPARRCVSSFSSWCR
jgi:hypothetical protein